MTAFEKARAEERFNRLLAYLSRAPSLCGCPVVPLTVRMVLELELVKNPCIVGGVASKDAVFDFLWRLNPDFACPIRARGRLLLGRRFRWQRVWIAFGSRRTARAYRQVERTVGAKSFSVMQAFGQIRGRVAQTFQDQSAATGTEFALASPLAPDRHWVESFANFYCLEPGSLSHAEMLDAPLARLFQIYREYCLARGITAPFIAPSAALIGPPQ